MPVSSFVSAHVSPANPDAVGWPYRTNMYTRRSNNAQTTAFNDWSRYETGAQCRVDSKLAPSSQSDDQSLRNKPAYWL